MTAVTAAVVAVGRLLVDLTLDAHHHHGWLVLTVAGEIDVYSAKQLGGFAADQQRQQQTLDRGEPSAPLPASLTSAAEPGSSAAGGRSAVTGVVLDLRGVGFIDSAGLGVLVAAYRRARAAAQPMRLVSTNAQLRMLLRMTRLDTVMPMYEDVEAAITVSE